MERYGLLGRKLPHSMSPFIHKKLFELSKRDAEYRLYEYDSAEEFLRENKLDGYNVTIPYKEDIYRLAAGIDVSAAPYGAVNCVDRQGIGYNTDVDGFRLSVSEIIPDFDVSCLLLGIGGVGKMIAKQFAPERLTVAVRNISESRISDIKAFINDKVKVVDIADIPSEHYSIVVNATPLGMFPDINTSPISDSVIDMCDAVYDTVYNPIETQLVSRAKRAGRVAKNGLDMLVYQAVVAHKYWYGAEFDDLAVQDIIRQLREYMTERI